jgi:hypothetical protein
MLKSDYCQALLPYAVPNPALPHTPVTACMASETMLKSERVTTHPSLLPAPSNLPLLLPAAVCPAGHAHDTICL